MGMASKGSRRVITSRVPSDLYEILEQHRRAAGVRSLSQFVADVLASHFGRADLILELEPDLLPTSL
ncbi:MULTISPECIES: ribbon-helix-helix protein, CopG family [Rhodococcus]|uniref:ribbon-helix-helix protein, CopG family n=1 Tax=Rhodococcus TaxID=1827 RepID=UPI0007AEC951|nr:MULTISPECIES: ribbon-helix-helix protein, CopG family [Rhodococcus]KZL30492.1 hypothetical protein A3852_23180 [Rhodococcus qingshengii]MCE4165042.1 ribbon-helix-helix protein, CopG family [Rhodococcus sp. Ni2]